MRKLIEALKTRDRWLKLVRQRNQDGGCSSAPHLKDKLFLIYNCNIKEQTSLGTTRRFSSVSNFNLYWLKVEGCSVKNRGCKIKSEE